MRRFFATCRMLEEAMLCFLLSILILLAVLQIVLRLFFDAGFIFIDPLLRQLVLWAGLLGAALATSKGQHISLDVVSYLVTENVNRRLMLASHLFSAVVCIFLTHAGYRFIVDEYLYGGEKFIHLPSWIWSLIFPFTFAVMSLRYLLLFLTGLYAEGKALCKNEVRS